MVVPPKKWLYIDIVLEIDGKETSKQIASQKTFQDIYKRILYEGQTQRLPWAIFISKSYYIKPRIINSGFWQDRDTNGRFIKTTINTLCENIFSEESGRIRANGHMETF